MLPNELQNLKPMQGKERLGAHRDSAYLGAEDIEPGTEPVLTIKNLYNGVITLSSGKKNKDVITFVEETVKGSINQVRPLVVNKENRMTMKKLYGSVTAETLVGKRIQLYIQPGIRNPSTGEKGDAIRIRDKVPSGAKYTPPVCAVCGKAITGLSGFSPEQIATTNQQRYGKPMCVECGKKHKEEMEKAAKNASETAQEAVNESKDEQDDGDVLKALKGE